MASKIETMLEASQGNCYPSMLNDLAIHLGVSPESVRRLAPGWLPIVQFKKGMNFQGWWTIPERDADGVPIGLGLRSQSDFKAMFPSSKHGMIYEINPEHDRGDKGYEPGAGNWIRTADAQANCPVCGKPDGCLLSAENPDDPKAVVCIRTPTPRRLRFGFLHIRKATGNLRGRSALADNGGPVVVVEGFSDTAAAMDLGFNAIGKPSNLACLDILTDLVRGRDVWVFGENDLKPDGKHPGKEGMVAAFQVMKRSAKSVKMVMPPSHIKDLRAWKVKFQLTRDELEAYIEKNAQSHTEETVIEDNRPLTVARAFLFNTCRVAGRYTVKRWNEQWHQYRNGGYVHVEDESFRQPMYQWAHDKFVYTLASGSGAPVLTRLNANPGSLTAIEDAMKSETLVHGMQVPCWINGTTGPDPSDLIVFSNGILHVSAYLEGRGDFLLDPTPDLFTTYALPYAFDPTATCDRWRAFLKATIGDDAGKKHLLREWFGYNLIPDTRYQKMMVLAGVSRGGKGTICHVLRSVLGPEQCVATKLEDLSEIFEFESWMNALAAIDDDAHLPQSRDGLAILSVLKGLTGEGLSSIKRKFQKKLSLQLKTRLTIAVNELPELPDYMGTMTPRLNLINFAVSFKGRENFNLWRELDTETPGIAVWALEGLRRLREQDRFTVPESSRSVLAEWAVDMNPLASFINECCEQAPEGEIGREELLDAWTMWSDERRLRPMTRTRFYERIKASASYPITPVTEQRGTHKVSVYRGIKLMQWAAKKFLGRPQ